MADEQPLGAVHLTRPRRSVGRRLLRATLREKGQALVEFAMVVPLLLLLVLGVADFGLAYNYKNDQTSMANQALRYAVVNSCTVCGGQSIEDYVKTTADSPELEHGNSSGIVRDPEPRREDPLLPAARIERVGRRTARGQGDDVVQLASLAQPWKRDHRVNGGRAHRARGALQPWRHQCLRAEWRPRLPPRPPTVLIAGISGVSLIPCAGRVPSGGAG